MSASRTLAGHLDDVVVKKREHSAEGDVMEDRAEKARQHGQRSAGRQKRERGVQEMGGMRRKTGRQARAQICMHTNGREYASKQVRIRRQISQKKLVEKSYAEGRVLVLICRRADGQETGREARRSSV